MTEHDHRCRSQRQDKNPLHGQSEQSMVTMNNSSVDLLKYQQQT